MMSVPSGSEEAGGGGGVEEAGGGAPEVVEEAVTVRVTLSPAEKVMPLKS